MDIRKLFRDSTCTKIEKDHSIFLVFSLKECSRACEVCQKQSDLKLHSKSELDSLSSPTLVIK